VVRGAPWDSELLTREIFGPIPPVVAYDAQGDVIALIERVLTHVMSGGVSINDALSHVGQHDLPFGGIGDSDAAKQYRYSAFSVDNSACRNTSCVAPSARSGG
jgi:coniferyl-aldehyde dehydrogenase